MNNNINNRRKFPTDLLFWALLFIGVALILLLDAVGVADVLLPAGLSIWRVLMGALIAWGLIWGIIKLQPFIICFATAGEVILFDEYVLKAAGSDKEKIAPSFILLLVALLLSIGLQILKHAIKVASPPSVVYQTAPHNVPPHHKNNGKHGKSASTSTQYFDCSAPFSSSIENNLGATLVFFTNTEHYCGESTLYIDNNMGAVVLHVPADFMIISNITSNMGASTLAPSAAANPQKRLILQGQNNMGSVEVKYQPIPRTSRPAAQKAQSAPQQSQPQPQSEKVPEPVEPVIVDPAPAAPAENAGEVNIDINVDLE